MRTGISFAVTTGDRLRLEAIVGDRNAKQKHVRRAKVILATADGCGTNEIKRRSELCKPVVWRWQERFMLEGMDGLLRDKTRKPGKKPLPKETVQRVIDLALGRPLRWLARHPRWTFHFTPTSASWLNAVEGFFAKLTKRRLKRGVFRSLPDLQAAINRFVAESNKAPKPFVWTADPDKVLAAVKRGKQALESMH
jgi:transposase